MRQCGQDWPKPAIHPVDWPQRHLAGQAVGVTAMPTSTEFNATLTVELAKAAAASAGLAVEPTELLRIGTNAVLRLPNAVVARVARDQSWAEVATREVETAAALHRSGVACVLPLPLDQPVIVQGHPVTFWAEVPGPLEQPTLADLGAILRQVHSAEPEIPLPALDPWGHTPERIEQVPLSNAERQVLRDALARVQDEWGNVSFTSGSGVLHGDAYLGNIVRGSDGSVALLDFDSVCIGPREWDLAPTGLYATSLGWITRAEYRSFVDAYGGFDVTQSPTFGLLARMRELRMTAWLAMQAGESAKITAEVSHRVACIADPQLPRHWSAR
jgi:aminoglycoside phosphotransferase (APT) family kinase protein